MSMKLHRLRLEIWSSFSYLLGSKLGNWVVTS